MATLRIIKNREDTGTPPFPYSFLCLSLSLFVPQWTGTWSCPVQSGLPHSFLHSIPHTSTRLTFWKVLLMSFSSSKPSQTPHCQQIRDTLPTLAFQALHNCIPIYPPHTLFRCLCTLVHTLLPLQCPPTFSTHSVRFTSSLASSWDPSRSPKLVVHFQNSSNHLSVYLFIPSFSKKKKEIF